MRKVMGKGGSVSTVLGNGRGARVEGQIPATNIYYR